MHKGDKTNFSALIATSTQKRADNRQLFSKYYILLNLFYFKILFLCIHSILLTQYLLWNIVIKHRILSIHGDIQNNIG